MDYDEARDAGRSGSVISDSELRDSSARNIYISEKAKYDSDQVKHGRSYTSGIPSFPGASEGFGYLCGYLILLALLVFLVGTPIIIAGIIIGAPAILTSILTAIFILTGGYSPDVLAISLGAGIVVESIIGTFIGYRKGKKAAKKKEVTRLRLIGYGVLGTVAGVLAAMIGYISFFLLIIAIGYYKKNFS